MVRLVRLMRNGRLNKVFFCSSLFFLLISTALSAEIQSAVRLDLVNALLINPDPDNLDLNYRVGGTGRLTFDSRGNRNVRAHLSILATLNQEQQDISLDRAYVITRFEDLRLTLGKTRASWGEGAVFNSGDLVMGSSDLNINLTGEEFRSQSIWLSNLYLSLDRFAFLEAVLLPPDNLLDGKISLGGRFLTEFDGAALKFEGGYFYRGPGERHQFYISLHGGEGLNWHLGTSLAMTEESLDGTVEDFLKGFQASGGLFFLENFTLEESGTTLGFNVQAELLFNAGNNFSEQASTPGVPAAYGLYGYLGASLTIDQLLNTYIRSIISPIDLSAIIIAGANFNIYQGFSLYGNVSMQIGDSDDTFINQRPGGYSVAMGVRFIF